MITQTSMQTVDLAEEDNAEKELPKNNGGKKSLKFPRISKGKHKLKQQLQTQDWIGSRRVQLKGFKNL